MTQDDLTLLLAGDALITRPWSQVVDPAFLQLEDAIWQLVEETPERLNLGTTTPAVEQAHAEG